MFPACAAAQLDSTNLTFAKKMNAAFAEAASELGGDGATQGNDVQTALHGINHACLRIWTARRSDGDGEVRRHDKIGKGICESQ